MDLTAIASAIAGRFAAAAITPPTGYTDPGTAVYQLPNAIASTPTAVVFPPEGEFSYGAQWRTGRLLFRVIWFIADTTDLPRATKAAYDWGGVLISQLTNKFELGLAPIVTSATVGDFEISRTEYAGQEYTTFIVDVLVTTRESYPATTT